MCPTLDQSMNEQPHDQDDLTAEIFGDTVYAQPRAVPREFKPWHKPRKQFVRQKQWTALLRRLYENRDPGDPLRYLGLPGTDLIDLRYLHEQLCRDNHRRLRFLGFNTEAQSDSPAHVDLNISLHEVRRLQNVDEQSKVLPDDFRRIGDRRSIAWSHTQELGPFDVINIDLCDGLASDSPGDKGSIYNALGQLMALQARNPNPWLLLLTTRIGRDTFDTDAEQQLISHFRDNVANCKGFAEACEQLLESDAESIDPATCRRDRPPQSHDRGHRQMVVHASAASSTQSSRARKHTRVPGSIRLLPRRTWSRWPFALSRSL